MQAASNTNYQHTNLHKEICMYLCIYIYTCTHTHTRLQDTPPPPLSRVCIERLFCVCCVLLYVVCVFLLCVCFANLSRLAAVESRVLPMSCVHVLKCIVCTCLHLSWLAVCRHVSMYVCMHAWMSGCLSVCLYVCMYMVCMYVCCCDYLLVT